MTQTSDAMPCRRRALAELDLMIEQAKRARARCRLDLGDATASARPLARARAMLQLAEERLERLQRSRAVLLGESPAGR